MKIEINRDGESLELRISGRLDTTTAPELSKAVDGETEGIKVLQFNLKELEYISSAGLRVLLAAYKKMKAAEGVMKVVNACEDVMEVFKITGFDKTLGIT